ncbi:hypothetical protein RRG08_017690 [Elysia crispata]|uniref:Uncharacterized protein n=1 Tax=Elysia crispata TaxID=231223 RepID=A0AAE1ABD3_9GAST|nr:hypothetical protein RRG08_017690 [Elysia crispata]
MAATFFSTSRRGEWNRLADNGCTARISNSPCHILLTQPRRLDSTTTSPHDHVRLSLPHLPLTLIATYTSHNHGVLIVLTTTTTSHDYIHFSIDSPAKRFCPGSGSD